MIRLQQLRSQLMRLKSKKRPFIAFQIEPTSRCQLRCEMCPRTIFSHEWKNGDMSLSLFDKIRRHFQSVENVHLQGWGEPLLCPDLSFMIQEAKAAACKTSLTTNGVLLTEDASHDFIEKQLDTIVVSVAGATSRTHESIRCGSHLHQIIDNIRVLSQAKLRMKSKVPRITLSFLMTKANIRELPQAVALAKDIGSDEMVATNVDYIPGKHQDDMKVFSCKKAKREYQEIIDKASRSAKKVKLTLRVYPLEMQELILCEMNPLHIVFLSHDGCVSPCVYVNLPKKGSVRRIFCGNFHEVERTCFGNIGKVDFLEIWQREEYRHFRESYARRMALNSQASSVIGDVQSFNEAMAELEKLEAGMRENPLPVVCRTCYKAFNI